MIRSGIGYDAHRLVAGRRLVIGGVEIEHERGLAGHSDADVLAHAVADAVLGAAGLGELGELFPASDSSSKDADSMVLLHEVGDRAVARGFRVVHVDAVIVADAPPLRPHREKMRQNLAAALGVEPRRISVKPKSNEGLGFQGEGSGMSAYAVATVDGPDEWEPL